MSEVSEEIDGCVQALIDSVTAAKAAMRQFEAAMESAAEALLLLAPHLKELEEVDY